MADMVQRRFYYARSYNNFYRMRIRGKYFLHQLGAVVFFRQVGQYQVRHESRAVTGKQRKGLRIGQVPMPAADTVL